MRYIVTTRIRALLAQQSGHVQLLIFAPILTLFLLSLVVRTANSAIDPTLEKKKINHQLKQRLIEVRNVEGSLTTQVAQSQENVRIVAKKPEAKETPTVTTATSKPVPVTVATQDQHKTQPLDRSSQWTIAGAVPSGQLLFVAMASSVAPSAPAPADQENHKLQAATTKFSLSLPWDIALQSINPPLLLSAVTPASPNRKKEEKLQAKVQLRDVAVVKEQLEGKAKKKEEQRIALASLKPVPLPAVASPIQKEEPPAQQAITYPEFLSVTLQKNETLEKVLKRVSIPAKEIAQWTKAAGKHGEFRTLRRGQTLALSFSQDIENPGLKSITYVPEEDLRLILERKSAKVIETSRIQPSPQPVWLVLGGRVEKSFTKTVKKFGLPEKMVKAIANLEWEGIALSDLDSGDPFKILFEAVQRGRKIIEYKALLAAEIVNDEQTFTAFVLPEEQRKRQKRQLEEAYPDVGLEIESEGEKFLRFPLEFSRISSSFSTSRVHPILHRARRHNGIDFAAPRGTPVYSVAKGVITFVGRQSGYGNIVKVDHPGPYETAYAHLQGFAAGITEGEEIERGRVVGYVGSTGLATGPHLHFELLKDGVFVNPFHERTDELTVVKAEEPEPVDPVLEAKKQALTEKLATLEVGGQLVTSHVILQPTEELGTATASAQEQNSRQAAAERKKRTFRR